MNTGKKILVKDKWYRARRGCKRCHGLGRAVKKGDNRKIGRWEECHCIQPVEPANG